MKKGDLMERKHEIVEYVDSSGEIKEVTFEEMETHLRFESCEDDFKLKCSLKDGTIECFKAGDHEGTFKMEPRLFESIMFRIQDEMEMEGRIEETFLD